MKAKMTAITLALCLCAALLSGCGGEGSTAPAESQLNPAPAVVEMSEQQADSNEVEKKMLGIVGNENYILDESDIATLCQKFDINLNDYNCNIQYGSHPEAMLNAAYTLADSGCKTIIFAGEGSSEIVELFSQTYPTITVLVENESVTQPSPNEADLAEGPEQEAVPASNTSLDKGVLIVGIRQWNPYAYAGDGGRAFRPFEVCLDLIDPDTGIVKETLI